MTKGSWQWTNKIVQFHLLLCVECFSTSSEAIVAVVWISLQVAEAEEKTAGGLLLTEAAKEKPSIGTVRRGIFEISLLMH